MNELRDYLNELQEPGLAENSTHGLVVLTNFIEELDSRLDLVEDRIEALEEGETHRRYRP